MKRNFTLFVSLIISVFFNAQNLVPNPSFEENTNCPGGFGHLNNSTANWKSWGDNENFPDYFHTCVGEWGSSVPQNGCGHQEPVTGEAYAGMLTVGINYPEVQIHIGTALTEPLEIGQSYYVSYYVNRARFWGQAPANNQNIGAKFYTDNSSPNAQPTSFSKENPHIGSVDFPLDTTHWSHIEGWFEADSAYTWIGLGNYFGQPYNPDSLMSVFPNGTTINYYYIDNVCVATDPSYCAYLLASVDDNEREEPSFSIFPNPVNNVLTVQIKADYKKYTLAVIDVSGRTVCIEDFYNSGVHSVNTAVLEKGLYMLRITDTVSGLETIEKFLKE